MTKELLNKINEWRAQIGLSAVYENANLRGLTLERVNLMDKEGHLSTASKSGESLEAEMKHHNYHPTRWTLDVIEGVTDPSAAFLQLLEHSSSILDPFVKEAGTGETAPLASNSCFLFHGE